MKKRAVCIILGVLLTGTMFTGCGKNKATEAASESAQTEKEGAGEDVETDTETKNPIKIPQTKKLPLIKILQSKRRLPQIHRCRQRRKDRRKKQTHQTLRKLRFCFRMKMNGAEMQKNLR